MRCPGCNADIEGVTCAVNPRDIGWRFTTSCGHDLPAPDARALWRAGMRWHVPDLDGAALVAAERHRHTTEEGYDAANDAQHTGGELAWSAWALLDRADKTADPAHSGPPQVWPLPRDRWPKSTDPLRLLIIAGSFIAAEIDRRLAEREKH